MTYDNVMYEIGGNSYCVSEVEGGFRVDHDRHTKKKRFNHNLKSGTVFPKKEAALEAILSYIVCADQTEDPFN